MAENRLNEECNSFDELTALMNGENGDEKENEINEISSQCKFVAPVYQTCNVKSINLALLFDVIYFWNVYRFAANG